MAVNFPSSPTNGQTITVSGITYAYDSTQGVWSDSPQGLTQAIDALTDVDTSTVAPTNGQVLQWNSTDSEWQPADSSAGVTVYATIDDLPLSGVAEGSMALVDSTDKLYIFSDLGWYSISIVNTTPSISGVSATYTLATDGTATVVTVTATDPEGIPIAYSIASDTSGNVATVTQGTGSNTNVFTITPSTNPAHIGTFSLTFRASDGVNIATAVSSFTLQFVLENSNYTTALITSVGANNAVNNSFDDASTNNHTVTANGNVSQSTFSPHRSGGYSHYFDGSGDSLSITGGSTFSLAGDFTAECWIYCTATSNDYAGILGFSHDGQSTGWNVLLRSSGKFHFNVGMTYTDSTGSVELNKWTHIALVRSGTGSGNCKLYIDGVADATTITKTGTVNQPTFIEIGGYPAVASRKFTGYITDVRVVNGSAVHTSNFTPPTERLTAITNTSLLTCHLPYIADGSTNSHSITVNGDIVSESFSPYDYNIYSASSNGGSIHLDGTGDYLTMSGNTTTLGTGDFTIECWVYRTATGGTWQGLIGQRSSGVTDATMYVVGVHSTGYAYLYSSAHHVASSAGTVSVGRWTHVAVTRESGTMRIYINGIKKDSGSATNDFTYQSLSIGANANGTEPFTGIISDARVVGGTAIYTADDETAKIPTAPLTAVSGTNMLVSGANAGIIDKSQSAKTITLYGDAKSSTTQTKFLSSSMYFDGTGDYIEATSSADGFDFGTLDLTIEFWMYLTSVAGERILLDSRAGHTDAGLLIMLNGGVIKTLTVGAVRTTGATTIAANTWYHVAVVRDSTSLRTYLNGSEESGSASYTASITNPSGNFRIGAGFNSASYVAGYISDTRITKGLARYPANFAAPTAALQG